LSVCQENGIARYSDANASLFGQTTSVTRQLQEGADPLSAWL